MADKIKLLLAVLILGGAVGAFYYFSDQILVVRVFGVLVGVAIAAAIGIKTTPGAAALDFSRGAMLEVRKVVWPSRKETTQTTLMVMAMVVITGIILWIFDIFLVWAVKLLTGQGS